MTGFPNALRRGGFQPVPGDESAALYSQEGGAVQAGQGVEIEGGTISVTLGDLDLIEIFETNLT